GDSIMTTIKGGQCVLCWVSGDSQSSIFGGEFDTREQAEKDIPKFKRELIGLCADESEREAISSGGFEIYDKGITGG
ncbi:MAG: hypothetical protein AB7V25_17175, partial [Mangrovibacterium sp.]